MDFPLSFSRSWRWIACDICPSGWKVGKVGVGAFYCKAGKRFKPPIKLKKNIDSFNFISTFLGWYLSQKWMVVVSLSWYLIHHLRECSRWGGEARSSMAVFHPSNSLPPPDLRTGLLLTTWASAWRPPDPLEPTPVGSSNKSRESHLHVDWKLIHN